MNKLNGRVEHVAPKEYLEAARKVDADISGHDLHAYYAMLAQKTSRDFLRFTREVSDALIPVDRVLGPPTPEDIAATRVAIEGGGLAGLAIARHAYAPAAIRAADAYGNGVELPYATSDDEMQDDHDFASALIEYGWEGISLAGDETADVLEKWESKFVRDVRKQSLFRVGAGVIFISLRNNFQLLLDEKHEEEMKKFKNEVGASDDMDWDAAFEKLQG